MNGKSSNKSSKLKKFRSDQKWIMAVGAILASAVFLTIEPLCKRIAEQKVLIWGGFFLMLLGRAVYIPMADQPPKLAVVENVNTATLSPANQPYVYGSNFIVLSNLTRVELTFPEPDGPVMGILNRSA